MKTGWSPDERYEVQLFCRSCNRLTYHLVAPRTPLSQVTCVVCGHATEVDTLQFMEQYVGSFARRVLSKPFQMGVEALRAPGSFLATLPGRVITKPFRVAAELRTTLDIVRRRAPQRSAPVATAADRPLPDPRRFRLLLSAPLLWSHSSAEILEAAADLGYEGVELWAYQVLQEGADPAELRRRAQRLGLILTLHALSWDLNPTSRVPLIREASVRALQVSIEMGAALGAQVVALHPGRATAPYDDGAAYWPALVEVIRSLADYAARFGIVLGVEHMEPRQGEVVVTAETANRLVRDVDRPNVGITLDVAHIPWGEDERSFILALERVVHVHFSDADPARLHLPLGGGRRDLVRCLRALGSYDGCVVIEGFSMSPGTDLARWNKGRFEELWQEARLRDANRNAGPETMEGG